MTTRCISMDCRRITGKSDCGRLRKASSARWIFWRKVRSSPQPLRPVTGSDDTTVKFWNVETGQVVQTLTGHTQRIYALAFTADGRTLLTGSLDGTARLWDWQSGRELRRYVGQGAIGSAIFSPDEQSVLIGSSDGKVYITPTSIEGLIQSVCRRVLRDLTPDERVQYIVRSEAPTCGGVAR